jgi:hypothetical protein
LILFFVIQFNKKGIILIKSLIIRGNETENAVCCTKNATFSFKVAEISNPLLLTSNLKFSDNIDKTAERSGQKTLVTHFC